MPKEEKHKMRRVVSACLDDVWAILPAKLEQICGFLELRANGYTPTEEEIQVAIAGRPGDDADKPEIVDGVLQLQMFGLMSPRMTWMTRFSGGTSTQELANTLKDAAANDEVSTIVLEVDSPGGVVTGTEELRRTLLGMRGQKRVVAIARGMAASAAYYVATAAETFYATPSSQLGSVGVFAIHREISKAAEEAGVKFTVFRAGDLKAADNPYESLSEKAAAALQARVDAPYRQFVQAVAENRGVSVEKIEKAYGQGTVFLADEALNKGMIDGVLMFDDIVEQERDRNRSSSRVAVVITDNPITSQWIWQEATTPRGAAEHLEEGEKMDPKVKAALQARGYVEADASDEQCERVLRAIFRARGQEVPEKTEDTVDAILEPPSKAVEKPKVHETPPAVEDPKAGELRERNRQKALRDRAELLEVGQSDLMAAIDEGISVDDATTRWVESKVSGNTPVQGKIEAGEAEDDKINESAVAVLASRCGVGNDIPSHARDMRNMSMLDIGRRCISQAGGRVTGNREADALEFLKLGGTDRVTYMSDAYAAEPSSNRAGDFPHLLSALSGKILDAGFQLAEVTYPDWCGRISDSVDFKPRTIIAAGVFDNLDKVMDDEDPTTLQMTEELMQWIQVDRYANKVGLTPVMVANDDLDAFSQQLRSLAMAHEATINTLAVSTLAANPTMPDGIALFAGETDNHYNLISSGGNVSSTTLATQRLRHRLQPAVGSTKKKVRTPPAICLVPPSQEEAALQALAPLVQLEPKSPATDATINTVRGQMRPIVENELASYDVDAWYTLADPNVRACMVYCFMQGYGRGGQRETWFENGRKTRYVALEGRFAVVPVSWRGIVKNPGAT